MVVPLSNAILCLGMLTVAAGYVSAPLAGIYAVYSLGQSVPHAKPYAPTPAEAKLWRDRCNTWALEARRGLDVKQCLEAIRRPGMKWG